MKSQPLPQSHYFAGPWIDSFFMGGLSLAMLALLATSGQLVNAQEVSQFVILYLVWVGNAPHFSATCYRLYHRRENRRQYPMTAWIIPWVALAGVLLSLEYPNRIAPCFVKFYLLWSPYHYSGQAIGLFLIYCRRKGYTVSLNQRRSLLGFLWGTFITSTTYAEVQPNPISFFGITLPKWGMPPFIPYVSAAATLLFLVYFLWSCRGQKTSSNTALPAIALVPPVSQFFWFMVGPFYPAFFALIPFFHGIQYLLVAWFTQLQEIPVKKGRPHLAYQTFKWGVLNVIGGTLLFWGFPKLLISWTGHGEMFVMPVAIAGVQIHHFFVDGVIWKLRRQKIQTSLMAATVFPSERKAS